MRTRSVARARGVYFTVKEAETSSGRDEAAKCDANSRAGVKSEIGSRYFSLQESLLSAGPEE